MGRYRQSDPIGLRGGSFSTYAYVNGNPISHIDPRGLYGGTIAANGGSSCSNSVSGGSIQALAVIAAILTFEVGGAGGLAVEAAEDVEGLTLFRGVASDSPAFENAVNGIANPIGGDASMLEHSLGNTASNFTSWTSDYDVALQYATNQGATSGVILTSTFAPGAAISALPSVEVIMGESEFLVLDPVSGAIVTGVP